MSERQGILGDLAAGSGWLLRCAALAVPLALGLVFALPARWDSEVVLLPPEREAANFRYEEFDSRLRRAFGRLAAPPAAMDPIDTWQAVLASPETARRLLRRFSLVDRWGGGSEEKAIRVLQDRMRLEEIPWGPLELHVETPDRELSADLANAAADVLRDRLRELYAQDAEWERTFLADASRRQVQAAMTTESALAASRAQSGIADEALQAKSAAAATRDRAVALARARTERARAAIRFGAGSPQARDAEQRVRELERAGLPTLALPAVGSDAEEHEAGLLEDSAERMSELWLATLEQQAGHEFALRVLDRAVPADRPDRRWHVPLALALALVPVSFMGVTLARREVDKLPPAIPGLAALRARGARAAHWLRGTRTGMIVAAAAIAAAAVAFGREPEALALLLGAVFFLVVAVDLQAAWVLLFAALPWAWDYANLKRHFAVQIPTEPGIAVLAVAWLYLSALRPRRVPWSPLLVGMLMVVGWMMVSVLTSMNAHVSAFQTLAVGGFVLVGGIFPQIEIRRIERIELVLRILLASAAVAAVIGIVQVIRSDLPFGRAAFYIGQGFLYNHGPYAAYLGFAMGPAFVGLVTQRWSRRQVPVLIVAVLVTMAVVVSLARAGWMSTAVLLGVIAVAGARRFFRKIAVPVAIAAVVLGVGFLRAPVALRALTGYVERSSEEDYGSNVDRLQRYVAALRMFRDRPITGVGPGAYETAYDSYRSVDFDTGIRGAHSELLRTASEQGLPGVLILAFLVGSFYVTGLRLMRKAPDPRVRRLAAALCAGMLTYTVHGLVNEYWRDAKVALVMWVFAGLLGALDRISREAEASASALPGAA